MNQLEAQKYGKFQTIKGVGKFPTPMAEFPDTSGSGDYIYIYSADSVGSVLSQGVLPTLGAWDSYT